MMDPDPIRGLAKRVRDAERIETPRLVLRPPVFSDAAAVFELLSDPEISRYGPHPALASVADANFVILEWREAAAKGTRTYVAALRDSPRDAIGFVHIGPDQEVGGMLSPARSGNGLATEGLRSMIAALDLHDAWTTIDAENVPLISTLEKVNFVRHKLLPRYRVHFRISPEPRDCVLLRQQRRT